jgi:outer membrane protein OmpA-like peptidoglycan-associated protein
MSLYRACAVLVLSIAAVLAPARTRAQSAGTLVTVEAAGGLALDAPQSDRFGPGAAGAVSAYYGVAPWLLPGVKLRAGFLSDSDGGVAAGEVDPGAGTFHTASALLRVRPFADGVQARKALGPFFEAGPAGVLTGELLRAGFEAGLGFGFALGAVSVAPTLRYLQVIQPSHPLSDHDARVLMLGAEVALLDARPMPTVRTPRRAPAPPAPVGDRDGDGLPDDRDACPDEAEDLDGFEDGDGCPDPDNDGDGLRDDVDRCPNEPEDFDGFEDGDGCPDPDNDGDGFLDADDQCPDEAEVVNGYKDYDGCPDEGLIELRNDRIVLEERVLFDSGRTRVRTAARAVLSAIVELARQHPEWIGIRIEGHADQRGDAEFNQQLSERRAANVRKALIKLGIPEALIESAGYGASRPRDKRDDDEAYQRNRRVEFVVVSRSAEAVPADGTPAIAPENPNPEHGDTGGRAPIPEVKP